MRPENDRPWLFILILLGGLSLLTWTLGFTLPALLFGPNKPIFLQVPFVEIFGHNTAGLIHFTALLAGLWAAYTAAVAVAYRLTPRATLPAVIITSVLLTVVALCTYPGGSLDIWHNVGDGRVLAFRSVNPLIETPFLYSGNDPVLFRFSLWNPTTIIPEPSYYGPLWYILTIPAALLAGDDVAANLLAFKLLPAVFFLLAMPLVYLLAERIRPGSGSAALVVYGWNPLLIWSSALDGHNDIIMAFFILFALHEVAAHRWETAVPLLVLGALVKYTALLLLPLVAVYALMTDRKQALVRLCIGTTAGLLIAALLWAPFWEGPQTLQGLRAGADRAIHSPAAAALFLTDPQRPLPFGVPRLLGLAFTTTFLVSVAAILVHFWRRSDGTPREVVRAGFALFFTYLALQSWWFFPWYLAWLIPLGAVLAQRRTAVLAIIYSASAMALLVPFGWRFLLFGGSPVSFNLVYNLVVTFITLGPPLLYLLSLLCIRLSLALLPRATPSQA